MFVAEVLKSVKKPLKTEEIFAVCSSKGSFKGISFDISFGELRRKRKRSIVEKYSVPQTITFFFIWQVF